MSKNTRPVILCVDDEKIVLDSLKRQLRQKFGDEYLIETAENASDALEILDELLQENRDVPLVISDQIMPGIKGDELLGKIHISSPKTFKILLTGQADANAVGRAVNNANLYRYISKPWLADELVFSVTEAVRSYFYSQKLEKQQKELYEMNQELTKSNEIFFKFVPKEFIGILYQEYSLDKVKLGDSVEKILTAMFIDIRSFTSFSESIGSTDTFKFINGFLGQVGPIIRKNRGIVDKYIGDAIMALFQNPMDAIATLVEVSHQLVPYNEGRDRAGYRSISVGMGLHTGPMILGTVGEGGRMQTTVIGDVVNVAARTEQLTRPYDVTALLTEDVYNALADKNAFQFRLIDKVVMKGKSKPISIYECIDAYALPEERKRKIDSRECYEKGVELYYAGNAMEASLEFQKALSQSPQDQATKKFLLKCWGGAEGAITWNYG